MYLSLEYGPGAHPVHGRELIDNGTRIYSDHRSFDDEQGDGVMISVRRMVCMAAVSGAALVLPAGMAGAMQNPTTGQPGTTAGFNCATSSAPTEPGNAANASGSAFNETTPGVAGGVYAGSDGTASQLHANSTAAVSQYDTACRRLSGF